VKYMRRQSVIEKLLSLASDATAVCLQVNNCIGMSIGCVPLIDRLK
jgi:hypothetical protein